MKAISIIAFSALFFLSGCATFGQGEKEECKPIVETKIVKVTVPPDMLSIPDAVPPIDLENSTQKDVALYLNAKDSREQTLEAKLAKIAKYLELTK